MDKSRFESYISSFPQDVLDLIHDDIINANPQNTEGDVISACTNLFVSALKDCVDIPTVSAETNQQSYEQIDDINQKELLDQAHNLFMHIKMDNHLADHLRNVFEQDDEGHRIEDFIWDCIGERIEESDESLSHDTINDIQGLIQTLYENCLESELYEDTFDLFKTINDYFTG